MTPRATELSILKKRSDFLAVSACRKKWVTPSFILQIAPRVPDQGSAPRGFGLTASKKMIGNAVQRNRARRRLRALARELLPTHSAAGTNYVFIARTDSLTADYAQMRKDLEKALRRLNLWVEEGA